MKIYVWSGPKVLKNYNSGMAVVSAMSADDAWNKLEKSDFRAYFWLRTGINYCYDRSDAEAVDETDFEEGFPLEPMEYEISELPVLVKVGGE